MSLSRKQEKGLFQLCGVLMLGAGIYLLDRSPSSVNHGTPLQVIAAWGVTTLGVLAGLLGTYGGGWPRNKAEWSAMFGASLRGMLALAITCAYIEYQGISPVWLWIGPLSNVVERFLAHLFAWLSQHKVEA